MRRAGVLEFADRLSANGVEIWRQWNQFLENLISIPHVVIKCANEIREPVLGTTVFDEPTVHDRRHDPSVLFAKILQQKEVDIYAADAQAIAELPDLIGERISIIFSFRHLFSPLSRVFKTNEATNSKVQRGNNCVIRIMEFRSLLFLCKEHL